MTEAKVAGLILLGLSLAVGVDVHAQQNLLANASNRAKPPEVKRQFVGGGRSQSQRNANDTNWHVEEFGH